MSNDSPDNNYNGYQMDGGQGFESNTENRHRKEEQHNLVIVKLWTLVHTVIDSNELLL